MAIPFIHPNALCESVNIGSGSRIWAFAHVLSGATIGLDCNICNNVFIENDVILGDRVTVKCGVQIWDGVTIEDDVFVGPNVTFTNDDFPRSKRRPDTFRRTYVRRGASIGANATILSDLEVGANSMVGAGAVVTRSVPPNAVVVGNPARIINYVDANRAETDSLAAPVHDVPSAQPIGVGESMLYRLRRARDLRGDLVVGEFERFLPFAPKRFFTVSRVSSKEIRGEHAHRTCHQFLICVHGSCQILLDDGIRRREKVLDDPATGIYMPPMIWGTQYRYSADAVLLVFASHMYDPDDYIRAYHDFRSAVEVD